ncbi:hypothetical protein SLEP1_g56260 [Rubroshorea leprosula]|uniref:Uncharacterized protein n=1 Tax=Rubroshorea leprosula TaxID=152421 RepID=A0AAV5ML35_9ROSI|nr:hypothetical protein SLEP1_g56260 [Rubroshorea leprosula]
MLAQHSRDVTAKADARYVGGALSVCHVWDASWRVRNTRTAINATILLCLEEQHTESTSHQFQVNMVSLRELTEQRGNQGREGEEEGVLSVEPITMIVPPELQDVPETMASESSASSSANDNGGDHPNALSSSLSTEETPSREEGMGDVPSQPTRLHRAQPSSYAPSSCAQLCTELAIIPPSHAQPSCTSPAPTPLLPALRPDRLHSAPACTLLRPALLPAPALLCTSSCALHQIACTLLALLRPIAGNDAPARPSHHQHSTPLPPCTPRLCTADYCSPHPCLTCRKDKEYRTNWHH